MKKLNFKNTTILITGASSGIGKEFAIALAKQGANLILTARTESDLVALADELTTEHAKATGSGIWVKTITSDLSEPNSASVLYEKINALGLSVDYLINNAGFGKFCEFTDESFATYHKMLMLNINALVELTHLCLPSMLSKNNGGVINVASVAAFQPLPYMAVYAASKAFVLSFSEALSAEVANTNVRIMALCPGTTESRFMDTANADTSTMKLAPASKVVTDALKAYGKNSIYTVSGAMNYFLSLVPRFVTRKGTVKIAASMLKENVKQS